MHMPRRWRAGIRIGGGALRVNTRTPADDHLYRGFSHAYQSQVDHVSSIFCHHFLISFGTRYSGIWHIDHICFAIWIWDRFPWICFIHWLYVFHVIILLQFLWPVYVFEAKNRRFAIFINFCLMSGFHSLEPMHVTEWVNFLFGINQSSWTRKAKGAADGPTYNQTCFMFFFLLILWGSVIIFLFCRKRLLLPFPNCFSVADEKI